MAFRLACAAFAACVAGSAHADSLREIRAGAVVRRTDDDLGTRLNLLARAGYCGEHLCLSLSHISHGSGFGIHRHHANSGLNFLTVEYRYSYR